MKISSIVLKAEKEYSFELNNNVTIIYDESGAGKTLLFKLLEYALGADGTKIDADEAKKVYKGLYEINMTIQSGGNEYLFVRKIPKDNKQDSVFCNGDIINGKYNEILNNVINYNPIKVIRNKTEMEVSTFSLREYVKCLFFDESRMTSSSSLLTDNYSEKTKIKNFYKYLLTAKIIDEKEIEKTKADIENLNVIQDSLNVLKKSIEEPTKENLSLYKKLNKQIEELTKKKEKSNKIIQNIILNKNEKLINCERLLSLKQLFESQIEDNNSARQFVNFVGGLTVQCECGRDVPIVNVVFDEDEFVELVYKIKDIDKQLSINKKEIDNLNNALSKEEKLVKELEIELEKTEKDLITLTKKIEDFDTYKKMQAIFHIKRVNKQKNAIIEQQQSIIDYLFEKNIKEVCVLAEKRLKDWGIKKYASVSFNLNKFDFEFAGTARSILSKGYRNICTAAIIIEILLKAISLNINSLNMITIDSFWSHLYIDGVDTIEIINNVVNNLENTRCQILIMENRIPNKHSSKTSIIKISEM